MFVSPQCMRCLHFNSDVRDRVCCTAFPEWIPPEILLGEADHSEPFPGDHGLRFEPDPRVDDDA